jgi:hypothetical protein
VGRAYHGLVPLFLGSIYSGSLSNLTSLWVDERVLAVPGWTVQSLLGPKSKDKDTEEEGRIAWVDSLRAALGQLESLRVGFGALTDIDAGLILDLCDPAKLTQFSFEWNWRMYGRNEVRSTNH